MSFNTLGNRDDTSLKLRSQNQQVLSKEQTKLLEMETEKMAERLMELKIAMSREKEEREKTFRGGGFWHSGQAGSLGSYPKEVLSKPMKPREQNSGKKITWLKNEPIVLPERAKGPCTMSAIADRKLSSDKGGSSKFKGRRCGQCEEKAAHVNCTECGEDYCAACFTAFHLKGALKKHRSTPIGSGGLRTPRADVKRIPKDDYKENIQHASGDRRIEKVTTSTVTDSDMRRTGNISRSDSKEVIGNSKSTVSVPRQGNVVDGGGSLLDGTYDPVENQKQFEEALREWRQGGKAVKDEETKPVKAKTPRAADVSVETATDGIVRQPVDIKFSSQSLSYAERLMLKKHRRMELGALPGATANPSSSSPSFSASAFAADEPLASDRLHQSSDGNMFQRGERADAVAEDGRRTRLSDGDSESRSHREILDGFLSSSRGQVKDSVVVDSSRSKNDLGKMHPANRKASSARMSSERQKVAPAATRIRPAESKLSIVELTKPMSKRDVIGLERSTTYHVIEIPDPISERTMPKQPAFRRISARPKIRKDAFSSPSGSLDLAIQPRPPRKPLLVTQTSVEAFDAPRRVMSGSKDAPGRVMSGSKDAPGRVMSGSKDATRRVMSGSKDSTRVSVKDSVDCTLKSEGLSSQGSLTASKISLNSAEMIIAKPVSGSSKQMSGKDDVVLDGSVSGVEKVIQSRTGSRVGKVAGSRAASKLGGHLKEGGEADESSSDKAVNPPTTKSRAASRPRSQMTSRLGQRPKSQAGSRPASRLATHRNGLLTKVPSEALRDVARMADESSVTSQQMDLGAYFTMAVDSDRREVMTPVSSRPNSAHPNGRWKVSNTLYQMGPRSWKPDTSLVETVSEGQARQNVGETQRLTTEAATEEPSSLPESSSSSTLNWSLSHGLSSAESPDKFSSRVSDQTAEPSGGKNKTSDVEISHAKKSGQSEVMSESGIRSKVLSKEGDTLKEMKFNFVQGHSVTPNMMIPTRFRRPGSGNSSRESQCGSRTGRESQAGSRTGRESPSGSRTGRESQCGSRTGRESQMIVYDGDELSSYDEQDFVEQQRENDAEAMKRLDLEIASETGLMAADANGKHSKRQLKGNGDIADLSMSSNENFSTKFHKLRESQLMCDFDEMEAKIMEDYEEEVKALK